MPPFLLLFLLGTAYTIAKTKQNKPSITITRSVDDPNSRLTISKDCKNFYFDDSTGKNWWSAKGQDLTIDVLHMIKTEDPLIVAFGILNIISQKNGPDCFKYAYQKSVPNGFPVLEFGDLTPQDIGLFNQQDLALQRVKWIKNNFQMWNLIWQIHNMVDKGFFDGTETIEVNPKNIGKKNVIICFNTDYNKLWNNFLKYIAIASFNIEQKKHGSLLPWLDDKDVQYHVAIFIMRILFPYVTDKDFQNWVNMGGNNISQSKLFKQIIDSIDSLIDDEIDMKF